MGENGEGFLGCQTKNCLQSLPRSGSDMKGFVLLQSFRNAGGTIFEIDH
jgi:hypothetical protein